MADRTVKVILDAEISKYIEKMKAAGKQTRDLEKADRDLKNAIDAAEDAAGRARVSEAKLAEIRGNNKATTAQLAAAEEEHSSNLRKLDSAINKVTASEERRLEAYRRSQQEEENSGRRTEQTISRVASRANAAFDIKTFAGLSLGLPAAAAVGAAGAAVAIGGVATLFAGLGAFIASRDDEIAQHWTDTMNSIEYDAKGMGGVFKGEVVGAIDDVNAAWRRMEPAVNAALSNAAPDVRILAGTVTDFAENSMPGMVTAVLSAREPLLGLRSFAASAGTGMSEFFANVSQGASSAGQGMSSLGFTVELLLSRLGMLFANLANGSVGPLSSFHAIVDEVTSALNGMTAQGSGVISFFQGFTNTSVGMVGTLGTLLRLISLLPPELTQLGGDFLSASMLASKFGIDAGQGFEGLGQKIAAAKGPAATLKTAIGGLAAGALNPAFLAVGALGIGLDLLGQKQAQAAAAAAAHAKNVQDLTQALRADNGVLGANTAATVAKALQDKNAATNTAAFGSSLGEATAAATGHADALNSVRGKANAVIDTIQAGGFANDYYASQLKQINNELLANGGSWDSVSFKAQGFTTNLASANPALYQLLINTFNATGAIGEQAAATATAEKNLQDYNNAISGTSQALTDVFGATTGARNAASTLAQDFAKLTGSVNDAADAGHRIIDVLRILAGQTPSVDEAMQAWNDTVRTLKDNLKDLKLKDHAKDLIDASGAINTVSEAGSKLQDTITGAADKFAGYAQSLKDSGAPADEIVSKLAGMRDEFGKQLKAVGLNDGQIKTLLDHYGLIPDKIVTQLGLEGNAQAQDQISNLIKQLRSVPTEKGIRVDALTDAARAALLQLGYNIVQLPDGKFQVFANTKEGEQSLANFKNTIDSTYGTVRVKATDGEAQATVTAWQKRADGTTGFTTLDSRIDPATGKIQYWTRQANGAYAWSTLDTRIDPATGKVQAWVRQADNTWGWANLNANTAAAESALNNAARDRNSTIHVKYDVQGVPTLPRGANRAGLAAAGGVAVPMASGGALAMASGGPLTPMSAIAAKIPPNTWRIIGDRIRDNEYYIPADGSARSKAILAQAMADPALQSDVTSGRAWVGSMAPKIIIPIKGSDSGNVPQQVLAAFAAQVQAAVIAGLSQASWSLDSRGVATLDARGRALNSLR